MMTPIHPKALKAYRNRKRLTQQALADVTRGEVSLPTIKRIESAKGGIRPAIDRVAEALAKALGVSVEELGKAPPETGDHEESLRRLGYRRLSAMIDGEKALAFSMVEHLYGISRRSQIEMAPLFAALLAEGCLAWRRKRLDSIEQAAERLESLAKGHLAFANPSFRFDEGFNCELESIEKRDLFGEHVGEVTFDFGFDPSKNNPFTDYIKKLAKKYGKPIKKSEECKIELEEDKKEKEKKIITFDDNINYTTGLPDYNIAEYLVEKITGDNPDARYALACGYVKLTDIPKQLTGNDQEAGRVAWMIAQIPENEQRVKFELSGFDDDSSPDESKGDDDA